MNRIEETLNHLKAKNQKALITYITAGLPTMDGTADLIRLQSTAGVDLIELGIPFSDPVADGPIIQAASLKAIENGTTLSGVFDMVKQIRDDCDVPIIFMLYYNTILYYGVEAFVSACIETGVDGLIIPDLPYEETDEIRAYLKTDTSPLLIPLVSPVSGVRVPKILADARGFVYCVSSMGVTGGQHGDFHRHIKDYLQSVKEQTNLPLMMGFGIRTAIDIAAYKEVIDGCVVGSHLIQLMEKSQYKPAIIKDYLITFKAEMNA